MKDAFGTELREGDQVLYANTGSTGTRVQLEKCYVSWTSGTRIYLAGIIDGPEWTVSSRVMRLNRD